MKKISAILLAIVMLLSMTAMAATLTVNNPTLNGDTNADNETYTAYKILTADSTGTVYTISKSDEWFSVLDAAEQTWLQLTPSATDANLYTVTLKAENSEATAKALAAYLNENIAGKTGIALSTGANTVDEGYYLVTTSMGTALVLDTYQTKEVAVKNEYPSLIKDVSTNNATVGDIVTFTLTVTVPSTIDPQKPVVVHDIMSAGFVLNSTSFTAVDAANAAVAFTKNEAATDDCTFELTFAGADVVGKTITITYTAEFVEEAADAEKNTNKSWVEYSEFTSTPDEEEVKTYEYNFIKVDGEDKSPLAGAEFVLKDAEGNEIKVVGADGVYTVADSASTVYATITSPANGKIVIKGLGNGNYTLTETKAPTGYNLMVKDHEFEIANADVTDGVEIVNNQGSALPSTGGIGTTIFYVVGGLMMAAAVVLLVAKKKVAA